MIFSHHSSMSKCEIVLMVLITVAIIYSLHGMIITSWNSISSPSGEKISSDDFNGFAKFLYSSSRKMVEGDEVREAQRILMMNATETIRIALDDMRQSFNDALERIEQSLRNLDIKMNLLHNSSSHQTE